MLCDVPIHDLSAGDKHLLQERRNRGYEGALCHLNVKLRLHETSTPIASPIARGRARRAWW